MERMESHHFALSERATSSSADGVNWEPIPQAINVIGSRHALAITNLQAEEFDLPLAETEVAVGNSIGRSGDKYIAGRVDKACLVVTQHAAQPTDGGHTARIGLVARVVEPYAVLLR
jgi:hypothetical protein